MTVQVRKIENGEGLERKILVEIPEQEYQSVMDQELNKLSKTQSIDGYRKGKVPVSVIKQRLGADVKQDVVRQLMQKYFYLAMIDKKLQPASNPMMKLESEEPNNPLVFSASFEVYPDVKLPALSSLKVTRLVTEINESAVSAMLQKLQEQHGHWHEVKRKAKKGDQLVIDFEGKIDGELFDGGAANDVTIELGSGQFIPGFEEGLIGVTPAQETTIEVTFPDDYQAEHLAGKKADFAIKVHAVKEKHTHELNEEFVKHMGIESGNLDELKNEVHTTMQRESAKATAQHLKESLFNALLEKVQVELPKAMLDSEINAMQEEVKMRMQQDRQSQQEIPDFPREYFEKHATDRVTMSLIVNEIIKQEAIKVDDQKLQAKIAEVAAQYHDPAEVIDWYNANEEQRRKLESVVLEEQVVSFVADKAKVSDEKVSYEDLMKPTTREGTK